MARQARLSNDRASRCCLVTGGAGFIGSHVARELLAQGWRVVCLDNLSGGSRDNLPENAIFAQGDIADDALLRGLFSEFHFEAIFHFAAFAAEGLSHFVREFTFRNNVCGMARLINAAVNSGDIRAFVFASSAAVYGKSSRLCRETDDPAPADPYGVSKLAGELDLRAASDFFGIPYIIFRLHNVYGEGQNLGDPYRNVAGIFVRQALEGNALPVNGDGSQTRQFSHVSEIAGLIAASVSEPRALNQIINLGSNESIRVIDLTRKVCEVVGTEFEISFLPTRNEAAHPECCHEKALRIFSDHPQKKISLEEGLTRMIHWARTFRHPESKEKRSLEIARGAPAHWHPAEPSFPQKPTRCQAQP